MYIQSIAYPHDPECPPPPPKKRAVPCQFQVLCVWIWMKYLFKNVENAKLLGVSRTPAKIRINLCFLLGVKINLAKC